jgi:OOP family OmpA-OmpF porin
MKHSVSLGLALGLVGLTSAVFAKTIVVPTQAPSIREAFRQVDYGDTIFVKSGVYNENVKLNQGVVLAGENPSTTIIDGGRRGPTVLGEAQGEIYGFTIRNGIDGILCENTTPKIHDNIIMDNHGAGIGAYISQPHIKNNMIFGNRWSGILLYGVNAQNVWIENNVIVRNGYSGISALGPGRVNLRNNILVGNHEYGVFVDQEMDVRINNNNIYHNYYPFNKYAKVNKTNLSLDPLFLSASPFSLNLYCQKESPMLGRGEGKVDIGLYNGVSLPEESSSSSSSRSSSYSEPTSSADTPASAGTTSGGGDVKSPDSQKSKSKSKKTSK